MLHFPILRAGKPYHSLNAVDVVDFRNGKPLARLSQANSGLIRKDFSMAHKNKMVLEDFTVDDLVSKCVDAAALFTSAELPVDGSGQTPDNYIDLLSVSTGMPKALCRANMDKVRVVLAEMASVLGGLTRGLDLSILDKGWGRQKDRVLSYLVQSDVLGQDCIGCQFFTEPIQFFPT